MVDKHVWEFASNLRKPLVLAIGNRRSRCTVGAVNGTPNSHKQAVWLLVSAHPLPAWVSHFKISQTFIQSICCFSFSGDTQMPSAAGGQFLSNWETACRTRGQMVSAKHYSLSYTHELMTSMVNGHLSLPSILSCGWVKYLVKP